MRLRFLSLLFMSLLLVGHAAAQAPAKPAAKPITVYQDPG